MKTVLIHFSSIQDIALGVDFSKLSDPDDLIKEVEAQLFYFLDHPYHYNIDFTIQNFSSLCDSFFSWNL